MFTRRTAELGHDLIGTTGKRVRMETFYFLYWNFLIENEEKLRASPRLGPAVLGLRHLQPQVRAEVTAQAVKFINSLVGYG